MLNQVVDQSVEVNRIKYNQTFEWKMLLVDDNPVAIKLLEMSVRSYGSCHVCTNGFEAVKVFQEAHKNKEPFDLIFLDVCMPEMSGHEVLKKNRTLERGYGIFNEKMVQAFMVTAVESPLDLLRAYYQGHCNNYIVKPITPKLIRNRLIESGLIYRLIDLNDSR